MEVQLAYLLSLELRDGVRLTRTKGKLKAPHVERTISPATENAPHDEVPATIKVWLRWPRRLRDLNLAVGGYPQLSEQLSHLRWQHTLTRGHPIAAIRTTASLWARNAHTGVTGRSCFPIKFKLIAADLKLSAHGPC